MNRFVVLRTALLSAALVLGASPALPQEPAIDRALTKQYFAEAKSISDKDNGTLWTVPLCGPLLFADPDTRDAVANQGDLEGKLKPADGVFAGAAPETLGFANTAVTWAGVEWTIGDVAAAAVQEPSHAIDASRVFSSRAEENRLDAR
jgi:hypothetical protein